MPANNAYRQDVADQEDEQVRDVRHSASRYRTFANDRTWPGASTPPRRLLRFEKVEIMEPLLGKSSLAIKVFKRPSVSVV